MDIAWIQSYYSDYRWRSSSHVPETGAGVVAPYSSGGSFCCHISLPHTADFQISYYIAFADTCRRPESQPEPDRLQQQRRGGTAAIRIAFLA